MSVCTPVWVSGSLQAPGVSVDLGIHGVRSPCFCFLQRCVYHVNTVQEIGASAPGSWGLDPKVYSWFCGHGGHTQHWLLLGGPMWAGAGRGHAQEGASRPGMCLSPSRDRDKTLTPYSRWRGHLHHAGGWSGPPQFPGCGGSRSLFSLHLSISLCVSLQVSPSVSLCLSPSLSSVCPSSSLAVWPLLSVSTLFSLFLSILLPTHPLPPLLYSFQCSCVCF